MSLPAPCRRRCLEITRAAGRDARGALGVGAGRRSDAHQSALRQRQSGSHDREFYEKVFYSHNRSMTDRLVALSADGRRASSSSAPDISRRPGDPACSRNAASRSSASAARVVPGAAGQKPRPKCPRRQPRPHRRRPGAAAAADDRARHAAGHTAARLRPPSTLPSRLPPGRPRPRDPGTAAPTQAARLRRRRPWRPRLRRRRLRPPAPATRPATRAPRARYSVADPRRARPMAPPTPEQGVAPPGRSVRRPAVSRRRAATGCTARAPLPPRRSPDEQRQALICCAPALRISYRPTDRSDR
jgi:hypothetical protein